MMGRQEMWLFPKLLLLVAIIGISSYEGSFAAEKVGNQEESYFQNSDQRLSKFE